MPRISYHGLGNRQPQWKLDYIQREAPYSSAKTISEAINVSPGFIYEYCRLKGIELQKNAYNIERGRQVIRFKPVKKEELVRPKAKYDNKSREERIEELLAEGTNNY